MASPAAPLTCMPDRIPPTVKNMIVNKFVTSEYNLQYLLHPPATRARTRGGTRVYTFCPPPERAALSRVVDCGIL